MTVIAAEKLLAGKAASTAAKSAGSAAASKVASSTPKAAESVAHPYFRDLTNGTKKVVNGFLPPSQSSRTSADRVFPYVLLVAGGILLFSAVRGYNPAKLTRLVLQGKMKSSDWDSAKLGATTQYTNQRVEPPAGQTDRTGFYRTEGADNHPVWHECVPANSSKVPANVRNNSDYQIVKQFVDDANKSPTLKHGGEARWDLKDSKWIPYYPGDPTNTLQTPGLPTTGTTTPSGNTSGSSGGVTV